MPISMPTPTKRPVVPSRNSLKVFLSKYCECGSRPATMPRDGVGDQLLLVDRLDVVALDHAEDGGQLLQFFERQRRDRVARDGLQLHRGQRAGNGAEREPAGDLEFGTHERPLRFPAGCNGFSRLPHDVTPSILREANSTPTPRGELAVVLTVFKALCPTAASQGSRGQGVLGRVTLVSGGGGARLALNLRPRVLLHVCPGGSIAPRNTLPGPVPLLLPRRIRE